VQYSEEFDNAWWQLKTDVTISANTTDTLDPSGYYNADKITETATTARHRIATNTLTTSATAYAGSVFAKAGTARYMFISLSGSQSSTIVVDLQTGTVTDTVSSGSINSYNVETFANGWYRISIVEDLSAVTTAYQLQFGIAGSAQPSTYNNYIPQYTGSTSNYLYFWGAQLEQGSYSTSYIPTTSAAVTRVADAAYKTGISSLIGQSEGVIFADITTTEDITTIVPFGISDGTGSNRVLLYVGNGVLNALVTTSGVAQAAITTSSIAANTRYKMAIAYKANDFAFCVNGSLVGTDTSGTVPACSRFNYDNGSGTTPFYGISNQVLLFKTRLTNAELAALTTL